MERQDASGKLAYITKTVEFSAAHYYYIESLSKEENFKKFGLCSNKDSHGHNYVLHVTIKDAPDTKTGMVINLLDLKEILKQKILTVFDHKNLNLDLDEFKQTLPTTENLCLSIWQKLYPDLKTRLNKITIQEDEDLISHYKGENELFYITRIYKFSASHKLHNDQLSEEENKNIFGKCNSYNAHGHNFKLEITLKGKLDPITGMVYDILEMDNSINEKIIKKFDHQNINKVEDLKNTVVTGENLTKYIWDQIESTFEPAKLHKIKLFETDRNYFEYYGGN